MLVSIQFFWSHIESIQKKNIRLPTCLVWTVNIVVLDSQWPNLSTWVLQVPTPISYLCLVTNHERWNGGLWRLNKQTSSHQESESESVGVSWFSRNRSRSRSQGLRPRGGRGGRVPPFLRVRGIMPPIFRKIVGQIRWVFGFWYGLPSEENLGFAAARSPSPPFSSPWRSPW